MMEGASDLLQSERGTWCVVMALCATALVVFGKFDGGAWIDFMKFITGVIVASKTVTTAVETVALKKPQNPPKATATYPAPPATPAA